MFDRSGSIEGFFLEGLRPGARRRRTGARRLLDAGRWRSISRRAYGRVPQRPGVCYFFPRPSSGSGCKRLNLFLRWMVRRDALDLGVWTRVPAAALVVPLDTHVIRVGRCLRLTRYTSPGWRMAQDITASLRRLDPVDPVKYDFALCHLGHDECLRLQSRAERFAVSAAWGLPATRAYTAAVPATIRSTVKRSRTRAKPASPIRRRSPASFSSSTIASASAS